MAEPITLKKGNEQQTVYGKAEAAALAAAGWQAIPTGEVQAAPEDYTEQIAKLEKELARLRKIQQAAPQMDEAGRKDRAEAEKEEALDHLRRGETPQVAVPNVAATVEAARPPAEKGRR